MQNETWIYLSVKVNISPIELERLFGNLTTELHTEPAKSASTAELHVSLGTP